MQEREVGKQRASRIPLDYFKRPNSLERWKLLLTGLAAALVVGWWSVGRLSGDRGDLRYAPGPVAAVHATWEANCQACHTSFEPIRDDTLMFALTSRPKTSDQQCQHCHAGSPHHPAQKPDEVAACSTCHQEHRGRDALLARVADSQCTVCHGQINQHRIGAIGETLSPPMADVSRFDRDHPDFRSIGSDPGTIKFSHRRHMAVGLVLAPGDRGALTVGGMTYHNPSEQKDSDLVQLACESCHQLDRGSSRVESRTEIRMDILLMELMGQFGPKPIVGTTGAYMQPISYDRDCKSCHPLYFQANPTPIGFVPGTAVPELVPDSTSPPPFRISLHSTERGPPEVVPHGLSGPQMTNLVRDIYSRGYLEANPKLMSGAAPQSPLPGPTPEPGDKKAAEWIDQKVAESMGHLQRTCAKCHDMALQTDEKQFPDVLSAEIPSAWFADARFDHWAHRAVGCRECHAQAYADDPHASVSNKDVLIPNRDTCLHCHSPRRETDTGPQGGARFDCVECHDYHHGPNGFDGTGRNQLEGQDAQAHGAGAPMDIGRFLSGAASAGAPAAKTK